MFLPFLPACEHTGSHHCPHHPTPPLEIHAKLDRLIAQLQDRFPKVASLLDEAGSGERTGGVIQHGAIVWSRYSYGRTHMRAATS